MAVRWTGRTTLAGYLATVALTAFASLSEAPHDLPSVSVPPGADDIVARHVEARGGLATWRKLNRMVWVGHIEPSAERAVPPLPFLLEQARPNRTRFEIKSDSLPSVRIFDGNRGWKLRAVPGGGPVLRDFSADEVRYARETSSIDGDLVDAAEKGNRVTLEGEDSVDGQPAYRLLVQLPSGVRHHVWIDAKSFLDVRADREVRGAGGQVGWVMVMNRDFKDFDGLKLPTRIETGSDAAHAPDVMVIERVLVNPPLDERTFTRPRVPGTSGRARVLAEPDGRGSR